MSPKRSRTNKGPERTTFKNGAWYYLKPIIKAGKNTTQWIRLGKTEKEMYQQLAELKSEGAGLMAAIIERYRKEIIVKKAVNTQNAQGKQLDRLKRAFGHMRPSDLRPSHIAKYHDLVGDKAPFQANRELALMTHVCKYAVRWGHIDDNPCREVQRFPEQARERYISDAEYTAARDIAPLWVQIIMDLAYVTGQRRIDLLSLTRNQITDQGILIKQSKTGANLLIEWTPDLESIITRAQTELLPAGTASIYIICDSSGQKRRDAAFTTAWTRLMNKAIKADVITEKFQFRDIRAKAGSDSSGEQLGHKSATILNKHYKRLPKRVKPTQ